jgi:hypothetical protein
LKIKHLFFKGGFPDETRPIYDCQCDGRLKKLNLRNLHDVVYTGLLGELEHLKIKTRLIDEMFVSVMGEYVL